MRQQIHQYFLSRGISDESITRWELFEGGDGQLRDRACFTIRDWNGALLAYAGRTLKNETPKYWNTPYSKARSLYGLHFAADGIRRHGYVLVVEDYISTIVGHQFGLDNTVATCGTSFSPFQLGLLARYTDTISVAFDPDEAGYRGARKLYDLANRYGITVVPLKLEYDLDVALRADPDLARRIVETVQRVSTSPERKLVSELEDKWNAYAEDYRS